jgi:hypothetical protein
MRLTFTISLFFIAVCNNITAQQPNNKSITAQLKTFINAVTKGNKEVAATFFNFPIKNEGLKMKIEVFGANTVTIKSIDKKTFNKYFNRIFSTDFIAALKKIKILPLETKNKITTNFTDKKTGCAITLALEIDNYNLKIIYNSNGDETCEFSEFWYFKLINNKLVFQGWNGAG